MANPIPETLAIVNPVSGRGRTRRRWPALARQLEANGVAFSSVYTEEPGHARTLAAEAVEAGVKNVVAVGGDGTTREVAHALLGRNVALGMVPTGGGNDFCKAVGIPLSLDKAVRVIARPRCHRVDVGCLNDTCFINGLGIGLDGSASLRYRHMRHLRGELGYLCSAVREALAFPAFEAEVRSEDWAHHGPALSVGASNGPYHGGDFRVAPHARADDGLLDVYVVRPVAYPTRLPKLARIRRGAHLDMPEFELRRLSWVDIELAAPVPAHMDGEPFTLPAGRARVEIVPSSLDVLVPHEPA